MSWQRRIEDKLDAMDEKLDKALQTQARHDTDLIWVKGSVKFTLISIGTALTSLVGWALNKFF